MVNCLVAVLLFTSLDVLPQDNTPKPALSDVPLTAEQVAVYRAVLADWMRGSDGTLNLANITEPIESSDPACFQTLDVNKAQASTSIVHRIDPSLVANTRIALVDPDLQQQAIKANDPQDLVKRALGGQRVTDDELKHSEDAAIASGLFQLSEIIFEGGHRRAVVSYSFVCGELCGNGNTLLLKKTGQTWKVIKRCDGWVS